MLKHMSKRELRALVGAEDPASPAPEPEAQEEAEGREEGLAEAARLARVGAQSKRSSSLRGIQLGL